MRYREPISSAFAKAVEFKSMNPKLYYNYGLFKEAESVLLKGITLNPLNEELHYSLTFVYIQTNNRGKVQQAASKLKQLAPQ